MISINVCVYMRGYNL